MELVEPELEQVATELFELELERVVMGLSEPEPERVATALFELELERVVMGLSEPELEQVVMALFELEPEQVVPELVELEPEQVATELVELALVLVEQELKVQTDFGRRNQNHRGVRRRFGFDRLGHFHCLGPDHSKCLKYRNCPKYPN
jgi:hypothetical protein